MRVRSLCLSAQTDRKARAASSHISLASPPPAVSAGDATRQTSQHQTNLNPAERGEEGSPISLASPSPRGKQASMNLKQAEREREREREREGEEGAGGREGGGTRRDAEGESELLLSARRPFVCRSTNSPHHATPTIQLQVHCSLNLNDLRWGRSPPPPRRPARLQSRVSLTLSGASPFTRAPVIMSKSASAAASSRKRPRHFQQGPDDRASPATPRSRNGGV
jgi:hypothetical protein